MIRYDAYARVHRYAGQDFTRDFSRHFGGGAPSAPPPPPPPPSKSDAEIQAEKAKASKLARNRKGRGASLLNPEAEGTNFLQPAEDTKRTTLG